MDFGLKLEINQKLVMTPQLRQAIAILQLSSLELADMVEQELLENPVLEVLDDKEPEDADRQEAALDEPPQSGEDDYLDWAEYFNSGTDPGYNVSNAADTPAFEIFVTPIISLHEHLELQLHLTVLDATARQVGNYLIGCIDDSGYLCCTVPEAAQALAVSEEIVGEVLSIIQTFDPVGVGARDLQECLSVQIRQKDIQNNLVTAIIADYLQDVAAGRYKSIADKLGCTPHEVQEAVDIIRTLDPKPGRCFGGSQSGYVVPDIVVERVNDQYVILVNDTSVPRLTVNPYYRQVTKSADSEARKFVEGRMNAAVWLIKSIEQRRRTLYNVMEAIIELQRGFFDSGPKFLQPLNMKKVADHVHIHESTVSRAIANKYVDTPHGLFNLRTFFSTGLAGAGGEDVSATNLKQEIKALVAAENAADPLSDQAIANLFAARGITLSRRTVTKYREELGIAASTKRKRY
jgi:RNA polymerase sigma-54 factor